jgi:biopolymer transport protein ExbD
MAKIKMSKKSTSIDMTAMCDVAFLLLTFFILTATAKVPEPITIDTPNSTVQSKLPDNNLVMVTVGKGDENVFVDIKGRELRKKTLELMGAEYGAKFTDKQMEQFALMESFGVPIEQLGAIIDMTSSQRNKAGLQQGIPYTDSIGNNNQLKKWIYTARQANIELTAGTGDELHFAIKGDAKLQYPKIKKIMDIFQDQKINTFDLVTGLRGKDF